MLFKKKTMKKALVERGYKHCVEDESFSRHGDYARNMQYVFSKEISTGHEKVIDIVFLSADLHAEVIVIRFIRENLSIERGVIENTGTSIPLAKFSIEEFEKQLDRLIPKKLPVQKPSAGKHDF